MGHAIAALVLLLAASASGAEPEPGITVSGVGVARAKPAKLEVTAYVTGEAEVANDAIVKHRDAKRRALESLSKLAVPGLRIEEEGLSLRNAVPAQQQLLVMQGQAANVKPTFQVTERLRLVVEGLDKLDAGQLTETVVKLLDAGKEAGLQVGEKPPSNYWEYQMLASRGGSSQATVAFKLADPAEVRGQAYAAAIEDARQKATRLAQVSGVKLGRVLAVREQIAESDQTDAALAAVLGARMGVSGEPTDEPTSDMFGEMLVRVSLVVRFGMEP